MDSFEFVPYYNRSMLHQDMGLSSLMNHIGRSIKHIHFNQYRYNTYMPERAKLNHFNMVQYLDITDYTPGCQLIDVLFDLTTFCHQILHLNITGSYVDHPKIMRISYCFTQLKTLRFPVKLKSSFTQQLDTILQYILIKMRVYLRYLHINFVEDSLLIMNMFPTENQLGEWLGHNQRKIQHLEAIELSRKELIAWFA